MRIFVFEPTRKLRIEGLSALGEVLFLLDGRENRPALLDVHALQSLMLRRLRENSFDAARDAIAPFGALAASVALVAVVTAHYGPAKFFTFDSVLDAYCMKVYGNVYTPPDSATANQSRITTYASSASGCKTSRERK